MSSFSDVTEEDAMEHAKLADRRRLDLLNRKERAHYTKRWKGQKTMEIDLLKPLDATDADGTIIKGKNDPSVTLKEVVLFVLRSPHQSDQQLGFKEKNDRYLIVKRISEVDKIALTEGEVKIILDRAGKLLLQVELLGKLAEAITPAKPKLSVAEEAPAGSPV